MVSETIIEDIIVPARTDMAAFVNANIYLSHFPAK